jgi:hypothetical protein
MTSAQMAAAMPELVAAASAFEKTVRAIYARHGVQPDENEDDQFKAFAGNAIGFAIAREWTLERAEKNLREAWTILTGFRALLA